MNKTILKRNLPIQFFFVFIFGIHTSYGQMEGANLALNNFNNQEEISFMHFGCNGAELIQGNFGFGVAYSISDTSGNLLFYVNNGEIYDANGISILKFDNTYIYYLGEYVLIVPYPGHYDDYYIIYNKFNNGDANNQSKNYCVYNNKLKTVSQNGSFAANEYFCAATKQRNKEDYWLSFMDGNNFYAYSVDSSGLHKNAIVSPYSNSQFLHMYSSYSINTYRFSPDESKLYTATLLTSDTVAIAAIDFDNSKGQFLNIIDFAAFSIKNIGTSGFSHAALSPDSKKLYFAVDSYGLNQYDVSSDNPSVINKSKVHISDVVADLFEGSDMKLYVLGNNGFGSINRSDSMGLGCNYELSNTFSHFGLDDLDYSPFLTRHGFWPSFSIDTDAYNAFQIRLSYNDARSGYKYKWNFGDAGSGALNHDTGAFVTHIYPFGADTVRLVVTDIYGYDEVFKRAICINSPFVHRVHDTTICAGSSINLNSGNPTSSHLWSTGDTTQQITISKAGKYWVHFQYHNLQETDSFTIKYDHFYTAKKFLPDDTTICETVPFKINLDSIHGLMTWNDSTVTKTFTVSKPGIYRASLQNACGTYHDSIKITAIPCNIFNINIFPNPFETTTHIQINLSQNSMIQIDVYDAIGKRITALVNALQFSGSNTYIFYADKFGLSPGIYFIKIIVNDKVYVWPVLKE